MAHAALTTSGRWFAALLAAGRGAALSHRSAAEAWDLLPGHASPLVELTGSRGAGRRSRRLRVHRGRLDRADVTRRHGIPVTTVERTLLDLAEVVPRHVLDVWLAGREVDLLWRPQRLAVELDGHAFHASPAAFERDRRRDVELRALGYTVLRFTWRQLERDPGWVVRHVSAALRLA